MQAQHMKVVSIVDEALDIEAMPPGRLGEYVDKRDIALVEPYFIKGRQPVLFVLKEIPHKLFDHVLAQANEATRARAAFQCGLVRVENMPSEDGAVLQLGDGLARYDTGIIKEAELERFDPSEILEIGEVAFTRSFFRRRTVRVYQLPPSWQGRLLGQAVHHAAQSRRSQPTSSSEASTPTAAGMEPPSATASAT